ncbi:hypothetical protein G6011_05856 [Alternaria panax]|uniref:Fe2OG dioxygenase domain-containing protein n=1 Tax=Alternaria panax TaxID=48097 RepID=A0AAD4FHA8_9PLEO|nr:hypothetical protein G6011_05856 [Alternaria panax]
MSDMERALVAAGDKQSNGDTSEAATKLNPTPATGSRYDEPIDAAQQDGLPMIDISAFLDASCSQEARATTAKAINAACVNYGFFYLTGHGIPVSELDEVINLARDFFAEPLGEKNKIKRFDAGSAQGGDGARGYQGLGENVTGGLQDMQEAIDWYAEWLEDKREPGDGGPGSVKSLQGVNLWPQRPGKLRPVYEEYIERVKKVGEALVHAMGVALDLGPPNPDATQRTEDEEIFVRNCKDSFWVMRMIGYPPLTTPHTLGNDVEQFSCGAHTDYGCVTLLLTDPTPGALQVQLKDGSWLNADPIPGAFVVNIGDMIERWTNGVWKNGKKLLIQLKDDFRITGPLELEFVLYLEEENSDALQKTLRNTSMEKTRIHMEALRRRNGIARKNICRIVLPHSEIMALVTKLDKVSETTLKRTYSVSKTVERIGKNWRVCTTEKTRDLTSDLRCLAIIAIFSKALSGQHYLGKGFLLAAARARIEIPADAIASTWDDNKDDKATSERFGRKKSFKAGKKGEAATARYSDDAEYMDEDAVEAAYPGNGKAKAVDVITGRFEKDHVAG